MLRRLCALASHEGPEGHGRDLVGFTDRPDPEAPAAQQGGVSPCDGDRASVVGPPAQRRKVAGVFVEQRRRRAKWCPRFLIRIARGHPRGPHRQTERRANVDPRGSRLSARLKWRDLLDSTATVLTVVAAGVVVFAVMGKPSAPANPSALPVPEVPLSIAGAPTVGSASAKVVMFIFSDFECPFCGKFASEIMPGLTQKYVESGRVRLVFRHFPLGIHSRAVRAAESAECAARQGRFWAMHDLPGRR